MAKSHPTVPTITVDQIAPVLEVLSGQNAFFLSDPGVGKTQEIGLWAASRKAQFIVLVASLLDRMDLAGLPYFSTVETLGGLKVTTFCPNKMVAELSKEHNPEGGAVVVYFNELNAAPESVFPVLYRLLNERAINDMTLRDNVIIVADGNLQTSASAGRNLQEAMKRRFAMFEIVSDVAVWMNWADQHNIDSRLMAFLMLNAQCLNDFDPTKRNRNQFACEASWERLSKVFEKIVQTKNLRLKQAMIASLVGAEAGAMLLAYITHFDRLPNIAAMMEKPETCPLPEEIDILSVTISYLYNAYRSNEKQANAALIIAARLLSGKFPEMGAYLLRLLALNKDKWAHMARGETFKKSVFPALEKNPDVMAAIQANKAGA